MNEQMIEPQNSTAFDFYRLEYSEMDLMRFLPSLAHSNPDEIVRILLQDNAEEVTLNM